MQKNTESYQKTSPTYSKPLPSPNQELMAHFNEWVTDPAVTIESVKEFVSDMSLIGQLYLGRYMVSTTSGSTGVPGILYSR